MNLQLVAEWKKAYAMYSIWAFAILGLLPDLYNLAISTGLFTSDEAPVALSRVINLVAFFGAASRLVQQKVIAQEVEKVQAAKAIEEPSAELKPE